MDGFLFVFILLCSFVTILFWVIFIKCCDIHEKESAAFGAVLMFMNI